MCQMKMSFERMPLIIVSRSFKSILTGKWLGFEGLISGSLYFLSSSIQHEINMICYSSDFKNIKERLVYIKEYSLRSKIILSSMTFREVY